MSQISPDDLHRITDYLARELPANTDAQVERWIAEDNDRAELVASLRQARQLAQRSWMPHGDMKATSSVIAGVQARIARDTTDVTVKPMPRMPYGRGIGHMTAVPRRWVAGAAVGAVAVLAAVLLVQDRNPVASEGSSGARYVTTVGQRATITLADDSRVTLAPQTTLVVAPGFGESERMISIEGEAVFEVRADAAAPFIVRTGSVSTRVLGTTFAVRRYAGDAETRVAVIDGKVEVNTVRVRRPAVILTAGMVGTMTDSSAASSVSNNVASYASWVQGRLVFQDVPVPEVLAAMRRWYGYEFQVTDSALVRQDLTIGLSTESAQAALTALKVVWGVEFGVRDGVITVSPARRTRGGPPTRLDTFSTPKLEVGR